MKSLFDNNETVMVFILTMVLVLYYDTARSINALRYRIFDLYSSGIEQHFSFSYEELNSITDGLCRASPLACYAAGIAFLIEPEQYTINSTRDS